jgi:multidrug efflux pump subunit AcrB
MVKLKKGTSKKPPFIEHLTFKNINYLIFGVAILVIIIGYFIMAKGGTYSFQSLTLAPIILLIGYLVIVPIAILYKKKDNSAQDSSK